MKVKDEKLFGASDKVYADSKAKGLYNESQDILDTLKQRKNAIIRMITKYTDLKDDAKVKEYKDKLREVERRIDNYSNSDKPMKMQEADKEDFESDMAHIEEFLNTKDGYATPEAEQILDTLYDDFITLSSKVHLDESADYPEDEKVTESKELKEGYYVKIFNSDGTDIDTYETNNEQEAIDYVENQKANGYRAVVYNADTKEALYDYDPNNVLEEDAWDDNFVINMLTDEKVYWKRKYDGKEIVTSFDIFKEPTDPTEWKSEEELTKYALEEGKDIAMNYEDAGSDIEAVLIALYKANCFNIDNLMNFIKDTQEYLTEASRLPNISKFVYDLDKDKGDAWSVNSYTEDNKGNKIIIVTKNGKSENTDKDIINAVEKKYPQLKGYETENHKGVWFYLNENNLNENIKESLVKKEEGDINPLNANDEDTVKINVAYKIAITYYQAHNPHKIKKEKMYSAFNRVYVPINIVKDYVNGKLTYEEFKDAIFKLLWDYYVDWSKENKNTLKELELYKITWIGNIPDDVKEKLLDNTNENNLKESIDTSEYTHKDSKFKYMLLDRLKQDCEYFLGNGNGAEKVFEGIDIDEELVEETKISDKLFDQLKELGITKEQAESTVKAIVNIFKNKSPEIVKESVEDVLDNLSNETVDKVSDIISKIKNLGWDGNIDTIEDYFDKALAKVEESKKLNESNAEDFIKNVEDAKLLGWDGKDETFKDYMKKVNDMRQVNKELKKENNEENTNKLKDINFKQWYMENVPEDNFLFDDLRDDITFQDILDTLKAGNNVYDAMFKEGKGGDSTVRENVFSALSDMLNVDYDDVYYLWLYPERDNKLKENKEIKKEADEENEEDEEIDNNILDLLQNRIGQNLTVGELNTILQGVLGKYNEVYLLTSDLYNMNPEEPQELVVFDDDDMYTITYNIEDMDNAIIQITDVELD